MYCHLIRSVKLLPVSLFPLPPPPPPPQTSCTHLPLLCSLPCPLSPSLYPPPPLPAPRQGLSTEYQKQSLAVLNQWESDIQRCKEAEDKLQDMFKQQQKMFQQQRVVQVRQVELERRTLDVMLCYQISKYIIYSLSLSLSLSLSPSSSHS